MASQPSPTLLPGNASDCTLHASRSPTSSKSLKASSLTLTANSPRSMPTKLSKPVRLPLPLPLGNDEVLARVRRFVEGVSMKRCCDSSRTTPAALSEVRS